MNPTRTAARKQGQPRPRKPLTPATGRCKWIVKPVPAGWGVLQITTDQGESQYLVQAVWDADGGCIGYRLVKRDGSTYDVDISSPGYWRCDCPDSEYRRHDAPTPTLRECKHARCLRAALRAVANDPPAPPVKRRKPAQPLSQAVAADGDIAY